jgi:hypothetical protein
MRNFLGFALLAPLVMSCVLQPSNDCCKLDCECDVCLDPKGIDCNPDMSMDGAQGTDSGMDGALPDGGPDASQSCTSHAECTAASAPACLVATGTCVECTVDNTMACTEAGEACNATTNRCENLQCTKDEDCTQVEGLPVCDEDGTCVECTVERTNACPVGEKACRADTHECVECTAENNGCAGDTPHCSADFSCVQCNVDANCTDPSRAKCDTASHECVPCDDSAQCANRSDRRHVCNADECVECTREEAAACNVQGVQYVCDPATHACDSERKAHSKTLCNLCVDDEDEGCKAQVDCVSNDECQDDQACVEVPAGAGVKVCQKIKQDGNVCPRPYGRVTEDPVATADGASVRVCTLATATTCQAHADYRQKRCGTPQPGDPSQDVMNSGDDTKCGVPSQSDGYCVHFDALNQYLCTVPCNNNVLDCPEGAPSCDATSAPDLCKL